MQKTAETLQNVADLYDDHVWVLRFYFQLPVLSGVLFFTGSEEAAGHARISKECLASVIRI